MPYNYDIIDSVCRHCDTKGLLALNLVSSPVHALAVTHLYKAITITSRKQLALLQHALVNQPRRRCFIRSVTLLKRVVSLYIRASIQPSDDAASRYVYGDIDIVECLTILLIPLPNLSHLEIDTSLTNLILAEPNMIRALNEMLRRSSANTVLIGGRQVSIPQQSFVDTEGGRVFRLFAHGGSACRHGGSAGVHAPVTYPVAAIAPVGANERNPFIQRHYGIDPDLDQRFETHFPLPFDSMELHPPYDPPFPILNWLGLGSYFGQTIEVIYQMSHNIKESSPLRCVGLITSVIAIGITYISKLLCFCFH